jgi:hypothetical protein
VTFAESFRTCQTTAFYGKEYFGVVEHLNDRTKKSPKLLFAEVDRRNPRRRKITFRDVALLYGHRPRTAEMWYLSPYEFVTYWEACLVRYPTTEAEGKEADAEARRKGGVNKYHAVLTPEGQRKVKEQNKELLPVVDYAVTQDGGVFFFVLR